MLDTPAKDVRTLIAAARARGRLTLSEPESKALLRALGIPVPQGQVVTDAAQAPAAAAAIGAPVVVKAVAHDLTHKTDAGGVLFPIATPAAAQAACDRIAANLAARRPDIRLDGFLIEAYRPAQPEWILALRVDPQFGPVIMFGLGGIFVDALHQVSFRLAPLRDADIDALITDKPAMRLLAGARGQPGADRDALRDAIRRLADLARRGDLLNAIAEIEINPLTITAEGVLALDALVLLRPL